MLQHGGHQGAARGLVGQVGAKGLGIDAVARAASLHRGHAPHRPTGGSESPRPSHARPVRARCRARVGVRRRSPGPRGVGSCFLQCLHGGGASREFIGAAAAAAAYGHPARRWVAALRPVHVDGAVRARPGLLRQWQPEVRAHARLGQRLRHRAGTLAAVRPHAGGAGGAGACRLRLDADLGVRRRLRRAGGATAGRTWATA